MSASKRNSSSSTTSITSSTKVCCFCNSSEDNELEYGKFYEQDGIVTHYYCLLLSSNMEQKGNDDEGILGFLAQDIHKELRRGKKLVCSYCKKIGATLGCCNVKCKRIFHYPCGLKAGSLHQFFGEFKSFCVNHRPRQKIDEYISNQINKICDLLCYICYDKANPKDLIGTLWAPCCKKDAWFHRKCVQQLALSAGYFFKCPLCNNKKDFQNAMLQHGIFIPSQDASWELVPNAFEELLYRHDQCDATLCLCPKGRKHTSSNAKWELVLCRSCGSQGIHMACGKLKWANPLWECVECTSILCKTKGHDSGRSGDSSDSSSLNRDSDLDESDSDISVGNDFPLLCSLPNPSSSSDLLNSSIKSRPGPRSFKIQQQLKANSMLDLLNDTSRASTLTSTTVTKSTTNEASTESNSAQESKANISWQRNNTDQSKQEKKFLDNDAKSQSNSEENVIITIESDDDDVEIISLPCKINIPTIQLAWANMFRSKRLESNSSDLTENSAEKSTSEVDPLQMRNIAQATAKKVPKKRDGIKESNVSKIPCRSKTAASKQPDVTVLLEPTRELAQKPTQEPVQELVQESAQVATSSSNDNLEAFSDISSVMNIKIINVTSLSPEVFANVPDVRLDGDVAWLQSDTVDTSSAVDKPLEKWFVSQQSSSTTMKRGMHEEANNVVDNTHKRIKGNGSDRAFTNAVVHDIRREQSQRTEPNVELTSTEILKKIAESVVKCATSASQISSELPSNIPGQKHNTSAQAGTHKTDAVYATVESSHQPKKSASKIVVPQSSELLITPVIQSSRQIYYKAPPTNLIYMNTQPISSSRTTQKIESSYAAASSNATRPPVIQNTAMIKNRQSLVKAQPINKVIHTNNSQQTRGSSNNQQIGPPREETHGPTAGNESSSRIVCDGDAGRTNPAVAPTRPAYFSEAKTAGADTSDTSGVTRDVVRRRDSPRFARTRRNSKRKACDESRSGRTQCDVFPHVTNNHNTCHQPRLIPQYMNLHDLKFRICGIDNIQMTLFDTFCVNIPVENPTMGSKNRPDTTIGALGERSLSSQRQCEALSSSDHVNDDSLMSRLTDDTTERVADAATVVAHDDAKENLDPVSRTVPRNVVSNNVSLANGANDVDATNDSRQRKYDAQTRLTDDVNSKALDRAMYNTTTDSNMGKDDDQSPRVDHREGVQRKQSTPVTEENGRLSYRRTIHNIDSDLNIVRTNRNVEKVLQNNVTVTSNRRTDDKGADGSRATNGSRTASRSRNLYANHRKSTNSHPDRTRSQTRTVTNAPNIMFNELSISNRQIDACDSSDSIRCMTFDDPTVRVSIDLDKIQNLIESKPELFASDDEEKVKDDDRCRKYIKRSHNDDYTQLKFHDTESNDDTRHSPFRNCELEVGRKTVDKIETRDSLYGNTFSRYRKRELESRYFDKRNR
ncbi:PREDICTED: uncharacterized protein LOC106746574 isoform X2 [Dinoponera quadriceps]|uniref:Uncharacterized protein LOC106746574 isoform X2 n=1 Tax=Dinoponera quadriceps TaxID=609295 RepID=A0A6P3XKL6_DINQU|nr:PREDICTED: uncharacterized protein LOC106746574 isoform X2 [Dinoponera quadriceps]